MSAELLEVVGKALYGQQWQTDLARDLDCSDRTVRGWAAGANIPDERWRRIAVLCHERSEALDMAINKIADIRGVPWDYVTE